MPSSAEEIAVAEPHLPPEPVASAQAGSPAPQQAFTDTEKRVTLAALLIVFLLSALDQTIVATAMPRIVAQLQGLDLYAWVTTVYLLSSTVMVPIWGKLSDIYGRKPVILTGMGVFIAGSVLCGMAGEFGRLPVLGGGMTQLIAFRALQGIGGGALFTTAFATIADLFPPRERGKFGGLFGAVFGVASVLGPVLGGFFTDLPTAHLGGLEIAGWRWCFYVNLPTAGLALFMIVFATPKLTTRNPGPIDVLGAALLVVAFAPLLLALSIGGRDRPWASPEVVGLFALSAAGLAGFVITELRAANPILSMTLFKNRVFTTANMAAFVSAVAFMGMVTFIPLFMQLGQGVPATVSGLAMLPLPVGLISTATLSGLYASKTGRYKLPIVAGGLLVLVAAVLLSLVGPTSSPGDVAWRVGLLGIGLGPSQSLFNLAVQNAVPVTQIGVVTSANQFFRQIGSTIGVAVFGAVLTANLAAEAARHPHPGAPAEAGRSLKLADLEKMAVAAQTAKGAAPRAPIDPAVRDVVTESIRGVVRGAIAVSALGFLATFAVPELPLRDRGPAGPQAANSAAPAGAGRRGVGKASKAGRAKT